MWKELQKKCIDRRHQYIIVDGHPGSGLKCIYFILYHKVIPSWYYPEYLHKPCPHSMGQNNSNSEFKCILQVMIFHRFEVSTVYPFNLYIPEPLRNYNSFHDTGIITLFLSTFPRWRIGHSSLPQRLTPLILTWTVRNGYRPIYDIISIND